MECVRLNVKTVPSFDPETHQGHTAYTVFRLISDESIQYAAGWSLRNAIGIFCSKYSVHRESVQLLRPFRPQVIERNVCCYV